MTKAVLTGAQRLLSNPELVPGRRWGMVTNYTAVLPNLELSVTALSRETGRVAAILSPEHGFAGTAQAGFADAIATDPVTGLQVVDTYGKTEAELDEAISDLKLDAIVADIQDVGVRFYTYAGTVIDCLRSAARLGLPFYILDRPNPLSGAITEGPGVKRGFESLVGRINVPVRHGLTLGELGVEAWRQDKSQGYPAVRPEVVKMEGWERQMYWEQTGLPWIMPSPNLPTPLTNLVYPGTGLFEGTNVSEGRGTTRPFELVGAPWITQVLAKNLNQKAIPGVRFREASFTPTFSKCKDEPVRGVQLHVTSRAVFRPVFTAVAMLDAIGALCAGQFMWKKPEGATEGRPPFIDLLWGSATLREGLEEGLSATELAEASVFEGSYLY